MFWQMSQQDTEIEESPDLLGEEDYLFLKGKGPTGTDLERSDDDGSETEDSQATEPESQDSTIMAFKLPVINPEGGTVNALIDVEDIAKVRKVSKRWILNHAGYPVKPGTTNVFLHQVVMPKTPEKMLIDHIKGNKLDARKAKLRFVSRSANARNQFKKRGNGAREAAIRSKYPGVSFQRGKWMANYTLNNKKVYLGLYKNEDHAAFVFAMYTLALDKEISYAVWNEIDLFSF